MHQTFNPRRIKAKYSIRQKDDEFTFPIAAGTAKLPGRDYELREPTPRREPTVRSEDFSRELQGESGESQPAESTDDAKARCDFWSIQGDFIYRHHSEPRVQLYVAKERNGLTIIGMSIRTDICTKIQSTARPDHIWPEV